MAEGVVFDIQRFSVNDGPGIRTTVFLKGCPLGCRWCHNPEGRDGRIQLRFFSAKCLGCGRCSSISGEDPIKLAGSVVREKERTAADVCPAGALTISGKQYNSQQLIEIIERDRDFYGNLGGVTFSGGEPTMQPEFLEEMLLMCRERGIHTAIDTCGYAPARVYEKLLPLCELVLYDIKGIDSIGHLSYTGKDNMLILENFCVVATSGTPIWVRIPLIPGFTANRKALCEIADFLEPYQQAIQQVTLIPYHSFGNTKYTTLGLEPELFPEIKDQIVCSFEQLFIQRGFVVKR